MAFPIEFPNVPIAKTRIGLTFNQAIFPGDFSRKISIHYHAGGKTDRWQGTITTPILDKKDANIVRAFVSALQGRFGTFTIGDPDHKTPEGFSSGDLLADTTLKTVDTTLETVDSSRSLDQGFVKGASQEGHNLITDGWPSSTTIMLAGDRIQVGTQYFVIIADAVSDGFGEATLEIEPAIRSQFSDNEPIIFMKPKMLARLQTEIFFFNSAANFVSPVTLAFEEVL